MEMKKRKLARLGAILLALLMAAGVVLPLVSCKDVSGDETPGTGSSSADTSGEETTTPGSVTPEPTPSGEGSVIFRDQAGTVLATESGYEGSEITAYRPAGYRTVKYFSDAALTQEISAPTAVGAGETSVYVSWSDPISYTVEFDAGPGLGEMASVAAVYDSRISLPACSFTKQGETFTEWRLYDADGGYRSFIDGAPVRNLTETDGETVRLVAVFDTADAVNFTVKDGVVTAYTGNAATVVFPQQAHTVSADVFRNNPAAANITRITVPADYRTIECGAFAPCVKLESLTVPFIGGSATTDNFLAYVFGAKTFLENSYSFSAELNAYSGLQQTNLNLKAQVVPQTLKSVTVTGAIHTIAEGAFYMVYGLEKLSIPNDENLYAVGDSAFDGCWQLGYDNTHGVQNPLWWLENVETIGKRAFAAYISETNSEGSSYTFSRLFQIPKLEKIRSIGKEAFYRDVYLLGVEFGGALETIGAYAFINCASVTDLILPDSIKTIGEYAFASCRSLETLYIGSGIRKIGAFGFADCTVLGTVTVAAEKPALVTYIPFSNGVDEKYDIYGLMEGYNPTYTVLGLVVPDGAIDAYRTEWITMERLIRSNTKAEQKGFYYGDLKDGTYQAGFAFDGKTLKVTDPQGVVGDLFNVFGTETIANEFTLYWEALDAAETGAVGEEVFYKLWSPDILDPYMGNPYEVVLRVRPELAEIGGESCRILIAEQTSLYESEIGEDDSDSLWKIAEDAYSHATLYTRETADGEWTEFPAPEGTVYTECYLYAQFWYNREYMAVVYEDANGAPITYKYFFSCDGKLIPAGYNTIDVSMIFYSYTGIQFILDGAGTAKINLFNSSETKPFVGSYEVTSGKWGADSVTYTFTGLTGVNGTLTGTATFDGFFGSRYHRCEYRLNLNGTVLANTIYTSADLDDRECIDRSSGNSFTLYDYKDEDGNVLLRYAAYERGGAVDHGTYTMDGDKIEIKIKNYSNPFVGTIINKRGSFTIANGGITTTYLRTDDEGYTFWYSEDFYGTTLDYYMIEMDGYGSATIHDTHDDDVDEWYKGTYYNTGRSVGSDAYGEYWVYCFEGEECDRYGKLTGSGKTATYYYVVSTTLDDADEGTILAISQSEGAQEISVYDEKGQLFATLSVDPFGITELTLMDVTYTDGKPTYTANTALSAKFTCVAYLSTDGTVAYVVVYDLAGNFMFLLAPQDGEWIYENDRVLNPQPAADTFVTPDADDLEKVGA